MGSKTFLTVRSRSELQGKISTGSIPIKMAGAVKWMMTKAIGTKTRDIK
jgi:hypothetical protein